MATERILVIEVGINRSIDVSEFKVCKFVSLEQRSKGAFGE